MSFSEALKHTWAGLSAKKQKRLSPLLAGTLSEFNSAFMNGVSQLTTAVLVVLWEYQSLHSGSLPQDASAKSELSRIASVVLPKAGLSSSLVDENFLESVQIFLTPSIASDIEHSHNRRFLAQTAAADFMPSCAVIGGLLGQDILNTIGGKELPLVNLFVFDGSGGAGESGQLHPPQNIVLYVLMNCHLISGAGDIHALGITHTKLSKSY